jgi:hypothetical protein
MLQVIVGVIIAMHGLIHLIGFVVPWNLATIAGFPYRTTALNGAITIGDGIARAVGIAWLACAVGFAVAGIGLARGESWSLPLTAALAVVSIVACALGLPEAVAGIVVNVAILGLVNWATFVRPSLLRTAR